MADNLDHVIAWRIIRVFSAVAMVVAYSISLFWIGTTVERRSLNNSLAGKNYDMLKKDGVFNDEFKERQTANKALLEEILRLAKECRK